MTTTSLKMSFLALIIFLTIASAGELIHEFKNPSFGGQGYSNHVLALEQLQFTREAEITKKKEREERDAKETKRMKSSTSSLKMWSQEFTRTYPNNWLIICFLQQGQTLALLRLKAQPFFGKEMLTWAPLPSESQKLMAL